MCTKAAPVLAITMRPGDEVLIGPDIKIVFIRKGNGRDQMVVGIKAPLNDRITRVPNLSNKTNVEQNGENNQGEKCLIKSNSSED